MAPTPAGPRSTASVGSNRWANLVPPPTPPTTPPPTTTYRGGRRLSLSSELPTTPPAPPDANVIRLCAGTAYLPAAQKGTADRAQYGGGVARRGAWRNWGAALAGQRVEGQGRKPPARPPLRASAARPPMIAPTTVLPRDARRGLLTWRSGPGGEMGRGVALRRLPPTSAGAVSLRSVGIRAVWVRGGPDRVGSQRTATVAGGGRARPLVAFPPRPRSQTPAHHTTLGEQTR